MIALPEPIDAVRRLVGEPSVSSPDAAFDQSNRGVLDHLAQWAEDLGFRVELVPLRADSSKANLIATLGDGPAGLVLSGHSDTVPFDEAQWATDPFELVERDGRLFGLGSADMKGFFAAALHAAVQFDAAKLKQPVILLATADEESTMNGARDLVAAHRPTARYAVIGEPTMLTPVRAHKGILMESFELVGRSGHSSDPSLGNSALEAMVDAIVALRAEREQLQREHRDPAFSVAEPTLNLGKIAGGDSPNRICASCSLSYDVRLLPGMDVAQTRGRLRDAVRRGTEKRGVAFEFHDQIEPVPPFETDEDAQLVQQLASLTGRAPETVLFCTEAPFLQALGMETVVCGPGSINVAHQPNEFVARDQLTAATELYAQLIHSLCVDP